MNEINITVSGSRNSGTLVLARAIRELLQEGGIPSSMPEEAENPTEGDSIEALGDLKMAAGPLHVTIQTSVAADALALAKPPDNLLEEPLSVLLDTLVFFTAKAFAIAPGERSALDSQIQQRLLALLGECAICGAVGSHGKDYDQFTRDEETAHRVEADAQG
jgi:hypothetical protein